MKINVYDPVDDLVQKLADYFIERSRHAIYTHGRFSVALSGGSSPAKLYDLLASGAYRGRIDWNKTFFFFGDERYVPATDPECNFLMLKETLFEPLNIDYRQVYGVDTTLPPNESAASYWQDITDHFGVAEPRFDLVLLGLGSNAHTASLFPFTEIVHEQSPGVQAVFLPDQQVYRISFTAPLINSARHIAFLVYGDAKAEAVRDVLKGRQDFDQFPAQLIKPVDGDLQWFLDAEAASLL